jgi:hypothetical protein
MGPRGSCKEGGFSVQRHECNYEPYVLRAGAALSRGKRGRDRSKISKRSSARLCQTQYHPVASGREGAC